MSEDSQIGQDEEEFEEDTQVSQSIVLGWTVLHVDDIEKTTEHYREVLGFPIDFVFGDPPVHAASATNVHFSRGKSLTYFLVADLDTLYENYQVSGAKIVAEPYVNSDSGMREMDVEDCNGHLLRFGERLLESDEKPGGDCGCQ
jgi:predicted enzyme related to lactoylglutathione lyase